MGDFQLCLPQSLPGTIDSALSVPYNIGAWFGGFLPTIVFAAFTLTGDFYAGLGYAVAVLVFSSVMAVLFLPETRGTPLPSDRLMSDLYDETHRAFQDRHDSRRLADRLESLSRREFDPNDRAFIEAATLFFIATVDARGRPTVSYKGGAPGFVRIVAPNELVFPVYDGNGMFLSLGNITGKPDVGLLFIDFQSPRRLRVQGTAAIVPTSEADSGQYPGAQYLVRVVAESIFVNCGRYIHKLRDQTLSPHVPDASGHQPFPNWKRLDVIAEVLCEKDQAAVSAAGGTVAVADYRGEDEPAA